MCVAWSRPSSSRDDELFPISDEADEHLYMLQRIVKEIPHIKFRVKAWGTVVYFFFRSHCRLYILRESRIAPYRLHIFLDPRRVAMVHVSWCWCWRVQWYWWLCHSRMCWKILRQSIHFDAKIFIYLSV